MTDPSFMILDLPQNSVRQSNKKEQTLNISVICFSLTGQETSEKLVHGLKAEGHTLRLAKKSRYLADSIQENLKDWTKEQFAWAHAVIFVGACGIAVRSIAPFVQSKKTDPAVLVVDECGKYVISLLSGHLGGANALSAVIAQKLSAVPVVTTATDLHGHFAVDVFAKKNHCEIFPMNEAKEVSAALLAGKEIGIYTEFPYEGELPEGLFLCHKDGTPVCKEKATPSVGISVTVHKEPQPFLHTVFVVPPAVVIGVGCKKGKEKEALEQAVKGCVQETGVFLEAVACLASIDLKKAEPGLIGTAESMQIPFLTFTKEELGSVGGVFTESEFVKKITGVENVCERSAVLASENGALIQKKICRDGVTAAAAVKKWRISFE